MGSGPLVTQDGKSIGETGSHGSFQCGYVKVLCVDLGKMVQVKSITINGNQVLMVLQVALQTKQEALLFHAFIKCSPSTSSVLGTC